MSNIKICKKCGAELPSDTKYNLCANCRGERANRIRRIGGLAITGIIGALTVATRMGFKNNVDDIDGQDINELVNDQGSI